MSSAEEELASVCDLMDVLAGSAGEGETTIPVPIGTLRYCACMARRVLRKRLMYGAIDKGAAGNGLTKS